MKFTLSSFRSWTRKRVTLLGMSGVGKTWLASRLQQGDWFHYSADYRIGKRYLDEPMLDIVRREALKQPFVRDQLRKKWIDIKNNVRIDDLGPVLAYVGKLGSPAKGGLPFAEFSERQARYRAAEIAAMQDVPAFIEKGREAYGFSHFVNDVGGSVCELEMPEIVEGLASCTLLLYIEASDAEEEKMLIERACSSPKPMYYRPAFLAEQVPLYLAERGLKSIDEAVPDDFARWVFPRLFHSRIPRYEAMVGPYGYTVNSKDVAAVRDEQDFLALLEKTIAEKEARENSLMHLR
jgi:hypothetical protein